MCYWVLPSFTWFVDDEKGKNGKCPECASSSPGRDGEGFFIDLFFFWWFFSFFDSFVLFLAPFFAARPPTLETMK